jgi:xanthine dehydrogenase YagS FAD-binding subunit
MNRFEWTNASSVQEAIAQLSEHAVIKAGGIDLLDRLKEGLEAPERLVNIRNLRGLDDIREDAGVLRIGPLVTLARIGEDKLLRDNYRALAAASAHAATPQIRNRATIGGNLLQRPRCWYFRQTEFHCRKKGGSVCYALDGENQYHAVFKISLCAIVHPSALAVPLVAMNASVELTGAKGAREVELERFFTTPETDILRENIIGADELITEVRIPAASSEARSVYLKQGERESFDWPIADVAVVLSFEEGRCSKASIVLGAAAPVPLRATHAEAALAGKMIDEETARAAARAALEGATPLSGNGYKLHIFEALMVRAILAAAAS